MIPAIIALVSVAGAWMTWRRNPLYSTRSALHSLAIILLAIVALVATIIAAVNFIEGKSDLLRAVTMHHLLLGPCPLQNTVRIRVRVVRLIAGLAGAIYPGVTIRTRDLVDLPRIWIEDSLPVERVIHPV